MLRTGLIVEVPDAELVVAHWREQLDPHAMLGVPAHVTVLFPFAAPDRIDEGISRHYARSFQWWSRSSSGSHAPAGSGRACYG